MLREKNQRLQTKSIQNVLKYVDSKIQKTNFYKPNDDVRVQQARHAMIQLMLNA